MPREDGLPPGTLVMLILRVLATPAPARLRDRPAHRAAVARRAQRRGGLAVSRAPETAAQRVGQGDAPRSRRPAARSGRPTNHARRPEAARCRAETTIAACPHRHQRGSRDRVGRHARDRSGNGLPPALRICSTARATTRRCARRWTSHRAMMAIRGAVRQRAVASRGRPRRLGMALARRRPARPAVRGADARARARGSRSSPSPRSRSRPARRRPSSASSTACS